MVLVARVMARLPSAWIKSEEIEKAKTLLLVPELIEVEETENETKKGIVN
jgi:hypothetical protein